MRGELELKWIFFLCIGIYVSLSPNNLNAQTWVTTDFWDINSGMNVNHDSTRIGPLEMCKAPNGNILMLVQTDVDQSTNRMMYNVTGTLIANSTLSRSG